MVVMPAVMPAVCLTNITTAIVIACIVRKAKRYNATFSISFFFMCYDVEMLRYDVEMLLC